MAKICVAGSFGGRRSPFISDLTAALTGFGHQLINPEALAHENLVADCLVYMSDDPSDRDVLDEWLNLVNKVDTDLFLTHKAECPIPAHAIISVPDRAESADIEFLVSRIESDIVTPPESVRIPRLLRLEAAADRGYFARSFDALFEMLANPGNHVIGVTDDLLGNLRRRRITNRREYDTVRFTRWSHDRLDSSFVKLTLRLAGGDSTSSAVTKELASIAEVLLDPRSSNLVVLKGAPGAGKSLQLRFLETLFAISSIRNGSPADYPLAFCVSLGEHAAIDSIAPIEWIVGRWERRVQVESMQTLDVRARNGGMCFLLDGFNEIPFGTADERRRWMLKWRTTIHEDLLSNPTNSAVVACRSRDLSIGLGAEDLPQTTVDMAPLSLGEVVTIAEKRNTAAASELRRALTDDPSLIDLYRTPFSLIEYLEYAAPGVPRTQSEIFCRRIVSTLARERDRNNYRIFDERWLPISSIPRLLEHRSPRGNLPLLRALPLLSALGKFAHDLTQAGAVAAGSRHIIAVDLDEALYKMQKYLGLPDLAQANDALFGAVDLDLLAISEGIVRFNHQTLQEFFAASTLTDSELIEAVRVDHDDFATRLGPFPQVVRSLGPGDELPVVPSTGFEEVFMRASELRSSLVAAVISANPWLASECIRITDIGEDERVRVHRQLIAQLRRRVETTMDLRERIAGLTTLGELGWWVDEAARGLEAVLSPLVVVPADDWRLGCSDRMKAVLGSTRSPRTISLDSYSIGLFPVTNFEFSRFVASNGYEDRSCWSYEGWLWRTGSYPVDIVLARWCRRRDAVAQRPSLPLELLRAGRVSIPEAAAIMKFGRMRDEDLESIVTDSVGRGITQPAFWDHARFSNPLYPVVGVCCYEADAYCRWLSRRLNKLVRLPTEDEWEAAALYAVGEQAINDIDLPDEWCPSWGNTAELHLERPSPVGALSGLTQIPGVKPIDMIGNVFEWINDPFRPGEDWRRTCKGGSWRHLVRRAHPGYRGRGDLTTRNDDDGFRIVVI